MSSRHRSVDRAASPWTGLSVRGWRRLSVFGLICALTSQMALPLAHASEASTRITRIVAHALDAQPHGVVTPRPAKQASHDPTSCVTCQTLLHAKPATAAPAVSLRGLPELISRLGEPVLRAHAALFSTGHSPRAPPQTAISLG